MHTVVAFAPAGWQLRARLTENKDKIMKENDHNDNTSKVDTTSEMKSI